MNNRRVLDHLGPYVVDDLFDSVNAGRQRHIFCSPTADICRALPKLQNLGAGCTAVYTGCQQALKHLHLMMFKPRGEQQVCNK